MDELAVDENTVDLLDIADRFPRLAVDEHKIGALALLDRAAVGRKSERERAIRRAREQRRLRREASRNEQFHFLERRDAVLRTADPRVGPDRDRDRKSTRLNSSH